MSPRTRRMVGRAMVALGVILLVIDVVGLTGSSSRPITEPRPGLDLPGYHFATRDNAELLRVLGAGASGAELHELNQLVFQSLAHGEPPRIRFVQCWPRWLAGVLYPDLRLNQEARRLVHGGAGLCSDAVIILNEVAARSGYEVRMVDLVGHVVSEIRGPDGWRVADPDFGIVYDVDRRTLEGAEGEARIRAALANSGHPPSTVDSYVRAARTPQDNVVVGAGVLNPRLQRVEGLADWVAWLVPVGLVLAGVFLGRPRG